MKFVLMVYQGSAPVPGTKNWKELPEAEKRAIYEGYAEFNKTPGLSPGIPLGLPAAARTVQIRDGQVHVKNGTYLKEGVGGFTIFEAENLDAAIAAAARVPAVRLGGAVEIRPVEKYW